MEVGEIVQTTSVERAVWGFSLVAAPALSAAATFFMQDGDYGVTGGTLGVLASVLWIPALMGLFSLIRTERPRYAAMGLLIAIYGVVGGVNFSFEGFYAAALNLSHEKSVQAFASYPWQANLLLWLPGPLLYLSLLVLAFNLTRTQLVPRWVGLLLGISAIIYPASRIPRIDLLIHTADVLLLIPLAYVGLRLLSDGRQVVK